MDAVIGWLAYHLSTSGGQILASVMAAIVQGTAIVMASIIGVKAYNKLLNKRHSFEALMTAADFEQVTLAMWDLRLYHGKEGVGGKVCAEEILDDDSNKGMLKSFLIVMNHYQLVSHAAMDGFLDKNIVMKARFSGMKELWDRYEDVVMSLRHRLKRDELWKELEMFVTSPETRLAYSNMYKSWLRRLAA
jgi:hypothetical protein